MTGAQGCYPLPHGSTDAVHLKFRRLMLRLGIVKPYDKEGKDPDQPSFGFYTLRRTFRTHADASGDQHAVHRVMGHEIPGMSGIYVQQITRERLQHVADHVYQQLFRDWTCKIEHEKAPDH